MTMFTCDKQFSDAVHAAVNGDAEPVARLLRSETVLGRGELEALISLAQRCAELARGDVGGEVGRRELAAGHPKVRKAIERVDALIGDGVQISQAKSIVAAEQNISVRTIDNYRRLTKEREVAVASATK